MLDTITLARQARLDARSGKLGGHTSGAAAGFVQGNVAIVPGDVAAEFEAFCRANWQPCPVLAVSSPGDPALERARLPFFVAHAPGSMLVTDRVHADA